MQTLTQFASTQRTLTPSEYADEFSIDPDCVDFDNHYHVFRDTYGQRWVITETPTGWFIVDGATNHDGTVTMEPSSAIETLWLDSIDA